ncbi:MAG: DUF4105 domain-containing protein [Bdellovibrionaceae bacterium]|nr:DUF4105 domain-containing protein [Pseudobdellovibrionaceae bacterium]
MNQLRDNEKKEFQEVWNELKSKKIYDNKQWQDLLHLEVNFFNGYRSQIKQKDFILSTKHASYNNLFDTKAVNPELEMYSFLLELFINKNNQESENTFCKFPARTKFLEQASQGMSFWKNLDFSKCSQLIYYLENLNAKSISFVFSSYYSESPGSAFGHTFFRVNKKDSATKERQELLDTGVSFAADVTTENPFLYAFYGLFGGFDGRFTQVPYYFKVREYNDFESRDLWSYELNLSENELLFLLLHLWEVGPYSYNYLFLTQNCSYHMLTVLQASVPRLNFTSTLPQYIIPVDVLKAITKEKELVKKVEYRPSLKRTFYMRYEKLNFEQRKVFKVYIQDRKIPSNYEQLTVAERGQILDAVTEYVDLQDPKGVVKNTGSWSEFRNQNLLLRSKLDFVSENLKVSLNPEEAPEKAHKAGRIDIGLTSKNQFLLGFRLAFHDLSDPFIGLPKNSSLEAFKFRLAFDKNEIILKEWDLFKLFQLNPLTELEKKITWGLELGVKKMDECQLDIHCSGVGFKSLFGASVEFFSQYLWLTPLAEYRYGSSFFKRPSRFYFGGQLGAKVQIVKDINLVSFLELKKNDLNDLFQEHQLELRWQIDALNSLEMLSTEDYKGLVFLRFF